MSRLLDRRNMTAEDILDCSYDLLAVLRVVEVAGHHLRENHEPGLAEGIARMMALAVNLHGRVQDALEEAFEDIKADQR